MKATNDVTEALQRTFGLMQGELERSVLSTQLLGTPPSSFSAYSFPFAYPQLRVRILHQEPSVDLVYA